MAEPRDRATRTRDTLALLSTPAIDAWVATASPAGVPHLVPLSLLWTGEHAVVAVDETSVTARNLVASGTARLGVGPTRDVVMLDVRLVEAVPADESAALGESYAAQADWDPRGVPGYVFLVLRPERVQAWREVNEMAGRTLLRAGTWIERTP
ncbi:pyridoxamine 5'-phosphate oxidase family protein [Nocardioides sp. LML1-1-1.1]|uniref:pyridoxamine 5'-phosphate oxidase family protein n=1 Tax=Nocardioides sp. LML1-1-1.1 TaxID=3135248 RepID=UPI0034499943